VPQPGDVAAEFYLDGGAEALVHKAVEQQHSGEDLLLISCKSVGWAGQRETHRPGFAEKNHGFGSAQPIRQNLRARDLL
jgi:hypothetical protein